MSTKKSVRKFKNAWEIYSPYFLYHNYKLKPKGYYFSLEDYLNEPRGSSNAYHEIYPEAISKLEIPENLRRVASDYLNYEYEVKESAKYILEVKNGRIFTDYRFLISVISEDDKLINEVSLDLTLKRGKSLEHSKIFKRKSFEKVEYFKGVVFHTLGGGGSYVNYYHWLIDSFSRLHLLKESGLMDKVDWFYVPTIKYDYQLDSLKQFGIPEGKIIDSTKYPHIKADLILAPSYTRGGHYHVHDWVVNFFHNQFPSSGSNRFNNGKYFISRKDSSIRNITNEDEVVSLLKKYDFETVLLSKLSFQEKIDLFANANTIMGGSGAGMTNFMFCKEGTNVIEIFGDQFIDFGHYYILADKRKLNYNYIVGKNETNVSSMVEGQNSDITINVKELETMLEQLLKMNKKEQQLI